MHRKPRRALLALAFVILLAIGMVPVPAPVSAQDGLQCAESIPNGTTGKQHHDLVVTNVTPTLRTATGVDDGRWSGNHWIAEGEGDLNVTVTIRNQGARTDPPQTPVRIVVNLRKSDGTGTFKNIDIATPATGASATGSALFTIDDGRYSIRPHVNSERFVDETCTDSAPTSTPGAGCVRTGPSGSLCRYEYYANNDDLVQPVVVGTFPDLVVTQIQAEGPARATKTASADARALVKVTVANLGNDLATHKDAATPGQPPFAVRIGVTGGKCTGGIADGDATLVSIDQVAAGATRTVQATCQVHGLVGTFNATATVDPDDDVTEAIETNQARSVDLPIPTADIIVTFDTGLPTNSRGEHVIAKGRTFALNATVANLGDAAAKGTTGQEFPVTMSIKGGASTTPFYPTAGATGTFILDPFAARPIQGIVPASQLTESVYTVTITADKDDIVLEANETNERSFQLRVASYDVNLTAAPAAATVAPGATGTIAINVKNNGNTDDVIRLSSNRTGVRFADSEGSAVQTLTLAAGKSSAVRVLLDIPKTASKNDRFPVLVTGRSGSEGSTAVDDIALTYTVGEDDVAPTITLREPTETVRDGRSYAYISGNRVLFDVTDNIAVQTVEADTGSGFETAAQAEGTNGTYRIDVTGLTDRAITLRATDTNGNTATKTLQMVRDSSRPRITGYAFSPALGALPGDSVRFATTVADDNLEKVEVRITQSRAYRTTSTPGLSTCEPVAPLYDRTFTLRQQGNNFILDEWVAPDRPGRYLFNVTATDRAGNQAWARETTTEVAAEQRIRYQCVSFYVAGMNIEQATALPIVTPREPDEGDPVRLTFQLRNINTRYETGNFEVMLVEDRRSVLGVQTMRLAPGETRPVTMTWIAKAGPHTLQFVVDRTDAVPESVENDNLLLLSTQVLFPDQALFQTGAAGTEEGSFLDRVADNWYVPVLLAANSVVFVVAVALGRRGV